MLNWMPLSAGKCEIMASIRSRCNDPALSSEHLKWLRFLDSSNIKLKQA